MGLICRPLNQEQEIREEASCQQAAPPWPPALAGPKRPAAGQGSSATETGFTRTNGKELKISEKTKRYYTGRIQYRAVQPEVEALLTAGYRLKHIHQKLIEAGELSISY